MTDAQAAHGAETRLGIGVSPGTAYGPVVQVAPVSYTHLTLPTIYSV